MTNSVLLKELNLYTATKDDLHFVAPFKLVAQYNDYIDAFGTYFVVKLNKFVKQEINTSPYNKRTKWRQCTFYLNSMLIVKFREVVEGSFHYEKYRKKEFNYKIKISYTFKGNISQVNETNVYRVTPLSNLYQTD